MAKAKAPAARSTNTRSEKTARGPAKTAHANGHANGHASGHAKQHVAAVTPAASAAGRGWDYAPAPETVKVAIAERYGHYINGRFVESAGGGTFETINPATEAVLSRVADGTSADVDAAVGAARAALGAWQALPGAERGKYLYRIARRIQERARELAVLETLDGGKPIRESRDVDVPLAAHHFFYYAGWADKLAYAFPGVREPRAVGVCGQVIPWNFPLLMAAWKIAPALAAGNTVVLKPAETPPLTPLRLAEIFHVVGLPAGVVNIVTGAGATGAAVVNHPGVDKVAFTGSTEVGKRIAMAVAGTGKRLTLELGGKSANIIFDDASIDQAVEGIVEGIFFNQGHVCCAGSRLLVQEGVVDEVVRKLRLRLKSLRVGDPMDKNTDLGAINSRAQLEKIRHYIGVGKDEGAELFEGGAGALPSRGYFCKPCVFTGVQPAHTIARDEIFGPVLTVMTFRTPEEALLRANNTPYGLAAGVWTDKGSKVLHIARKLEAGVLWLNTYNRFDAASPFGGYKESGFGREGGLHGLKPYVNVDA
ncbi:MAG: aldehyde dehydrogenase family protein [Phycisphaeraceae bacterium]|nr:aldehyde dehydrogenase family protein [Phycisphaeraceae bacterium]